jgi:threonylcarbamoyladenosine tRNA methylthiotransferase MtaB
MRTLLTHTLGCKLNQAETHALGARFRAAGFDVSGLGGGGDVVLINSCTVTETAEIECRKLVRRALRHNPLAFVIVTGCYAQLRPEEVASIEGVDLVLGSAEKARALELAGDMQKGAVPKVLVSEIASDRSFGPAFTGAEDGRARAFLKVQDGCDYRCSFCTIPKARGASRSQPTADAVAQARKLVGQGFGEIVLTGVNVGDYGGQSGSNLAELLRALLGDVPGLLRLKVSSIEPNLLTDEIVELAAADPRLLPHFHVPLQSGSERVLRMMRRRYQPEEYARRVERIVERVPHCAIGVDVIVGFPGETERDFLDTVDFLAGLPVAYLHVFTYSERPDTPAAGMGEQVDREERRRRTRALRQLSERKLARFAARHEGQVRPVLFERVQDDGLLTGLTDNYIRVDVAGPPDLEGRVVSVRIGAFSQGRAVGVLAQSGSARLPNDPVSPPVATTEVHP